MKTPATNHHHESKPHISNTAPEMANEEMAARLRRLLPEAPPQPMFTRMVMNRLTHRSTRIASFVEYALYIIGIATTGVIATRIATQIFKAPMVSENQTLTLITLIVVFFSLIYALLSPWFGESEEQ